MNCVITWVFFSGQLEPSALLDFLEIVFWLVLIVCVYNWQISWCRHCYQLKGLSELDQHYREFYLLCKQNINSIKHRSYERLNLHEPCEIRFYINLRFKMATWNHWTKGAIFIYVRLWLFLWLNTKTDENLVKVLRLNGRNSRDLTRILLIL